jgi:hypothetical protein
MEVAIRWLPDITYLCELTPNLLFIHDFNLKNLNTKKVRG